MKLLLDIGNTRLKWAVLSAIDQFIFGGVVVINEEKLPELFDDILRSHSEISSVWVSNVAGVHYQQAIHQWWSSHFPETTIHFIQTENGWLDLQVAYPEPGCFGVDRWAALLALKEEETTAFCSIDCGTAITLDLVDVNGQHLGSHILPGLRLLCSLIKENTVGCRNVPIDCVGTVNQLANNTADALKNGTLTAVVAYIDKMVEHWLVNLQKEVSVFITGGDASTILPYLKQPVCHRPHLVLQGVALISKQGDKIASLKSDG